jgi:CRP-like cAMP-binding protein
MAKLIPSETRVCNHAFLKNIFVSDMGLTDAHYQQFVDSLKTVHLAKKEILQHADSVCNFIGYVEKGVLRSYIQKESDEFNLDFYLPCTWVSSYTSFLTRMPTQGNIQALTDTTVRLIAHDDYHRLLQSSNDWYRFGMYIANHLFVRKCRREASLLMDSADERYKLLLHSYPKIEQLVPQYHIASYLGIQPESLSRIKALTYINEKA